VFGILNSLERPHLLSCLSSKRVRDAGVSRMSRTRSAPSLWRVRDSDDYPTFPGVRNPVTQARSEICFGRRSNFDLLSYRRFEGVICGCSFIPICFYLYERAFSRYECGLSELFRRGYSFKPKRPKSLCLRSSPVDISRTPGFDFMLWGWFLNTKYPRVYLRMKTFAILVATRGNHVICAEVSTGVRLPRVKFKENPGN